MRTTRIIFVAICFVILLTSVSAHSSSQSWCIDSVDEKHIGGENVGWIVNEAAHTNGNVPTYTIKTGAFELTNQMKTALTSACLRWSSVVRFTESTNGTGTIMRMSIVYDKNEFAYYKANSVDSNGHLTSWVIQISEDNWSKYTEEEQIASIAHELGHAIGLSDLYNDQNSDKIMYGYVKGCTAYTPSLADKWGARVITGQHTTHRWTGTKANHTCTSCGGIKTHSLSIANYSYTSNGASGHRVSIGCSDCNYSYTEPHGKNYSEILGRCSACGYTGATQLSVGNNIE